MNANQRRDRKKKTVENIKLVISHPFFCFRVSQQEFVSQRSPTAKLRFVCDIFAWLRIFPLRVHQSQRSTIPRNWGFCIADLAVVFWKRTLLEWEFSDSFIRRKKSDWAISFADSPIVWGRLGGVGGIGMLNARRQLRKSAPSLQSTSALRI